MKFPDDQISVMSPEFYSSKRVFFGFTKKTSLQQNGQPILMNAKEFG
jgi:hypothetical protein